MNCWLHRISHHAEVSYPLLSKNLLTIGFSDFAYPTFIDDVLEGGWEAIEEAFDDEWGYRPRSRHSLCRFIYDMKKGDLIVVPSWGTFSIYKLVGERPNQIGNTPLPEIADWHGQRLDLQDGLLTNKEGGKIDIGFTWEVEPIATNISRSEYADAALTARMKVRTTNAWISDIKDSIDKAVGAYSIKKPINLHSQILEATVPLVLNRLRSELNPDKFECLVKWYFERIGASEVYIPSKNESAKEGDADVIAAFERIRTIIYTQVKFHEGETSSWALDQIKMYRDNKDLMDDGYSRICWVISSADKFSDQCYALAKENKVQLIDGPRFSHMLLEAGLTDLDKAL